MVEGLPCQQEPGYSASERDGSPDQPQRPGLLLEDAPEKQAEEKHEGQDADEDEYQIGFQCSPPGVSDYLTIDESVLLGYADI